MQMQIEQSLKQAASQKMIQSAQILQLNTAELYRYLENLALENPLMDFIPPASDSIPKRAIPQTADEQNRSYDRQEQAEQRELWDPEVAQTLPEALLFQLSGTALDAQQRRILKYMIYNLDSNGYLSVSPEDIPAALGCSQAAAEEALALLQSLEPCGVGARNLSECLCIQLRRLYPKEHTALEIARNELEQLGKNQLPALAKKLHQPLQAVLHARDVIRSLNPRPGAGYGGGECSSYICPELLVSQQNGRFCVTLNEPQPLTIQFNASYLQMLQDGSGEAAAYLEKKKEQLEWVQQCIAQRSRTLLSLGDLILEVQQSFFRSGPAYLRSFTQAEAAGALNMHESTVSRAIHEKYLQCAWGVFPLQYFFPQGLQQRHEICRQLRQMIALEDKRRPLSDQALCSALGNAGYSISRRMVSKYRESLNIPDASCRREYEK